MEPGRNVKVRNALQDHGSAGFRHYRELYYGRTSFGCILRAELTISMLGTWPGALGIWLRSKFYPSLFAAAGRKILIGRNVTFRHPKKIRLGSNVIIDDNSLIDAKGETNEGITIGDNVYLGRNTVVYCKNGNIRLEDRVNLSANCTVFSSNSLTVGAGTMVAAYCYLLSGGEYDYRDPAPFAEQSGMKTRGPLTVGPDCWLGARVVVLDSASIGERCVIAAGAVVTKPVPPGRLAMGVPARVLKTIRR